MQGYLDMFLNLTGNLATSITLAITIITSASLLLVNVARYFQAKKYGIPLSMVNQASLPDSLDLWVILITAFGFGWIIPDYVARSDMNIFLALGIAFLSLFTSIMFMRNKSYFSIRHENGSESILDIGIFIRPKAWKIAVFTFIVACLFVYVGFAYRQWVVDYNFDGNIVVYVIYRGALIGLRIFRILIVTMFVVSILAKIYGDKDIMTVDIDGKPYLLATRHSQYQWILMTCVIEKNNAKSEDSTIKAEYIIKYTRGKFIIRDMSTLEEHCPVVCRKDYALRGIIESDSTPEENA